MAFQQAKRYAEALPEWPPFLIVCDVGYCFDVYADFSCSGKNYELFPDPRSSRIPLQDLTKPEVQAFLKAVWLDPHSLDPSKKSAKVTRELADRLAKLAKSLESSAADKATQTADESHQRAHQVAQFLMRCLFTMFAEDVELIPKGSFVGLLDSHVFRSSISFDIPVHLRFEWANDDAGIYLSLSINNSERDCRIGSRRLDFSLNMAGFLLGTDISHRHFAKFYMLEAYVTGTTMSVMDKLGSYHYFKRKISGPVNAMWFGGMHFMQRNENGHMVQEQFEHCPIFREGITCLNSE